MSPGDLIALVGLGLLLIVLLVQQMRATVWIGWYVLWFTAFATWVLISPWPMEVLA